VKLETARRRIRELDDVILASAAERIALAREVATIKAAQSLPTVDFRQERLVLERGRDTAARHELDPDLAESILSMLMSASVSKQEEHRLRCAAAGRGRTAVVVGGAGRMGRWMVDFLRAQEFEVGILDPNAPGGLDAGVRERLGDSDLVVSAAPPGRTADLYREWRSNPPAGVVCDMASIKSPLVEPIRALQAAGIRVASFHPLFGPATTALRNSDVVICDVGDPEAEEIVAGLFAPTLARIVRIDIDEHDKLMAEMLTLAHAATLAFAGARLAGSPRSIELHSTTERALESLAARVVRESPEVYFEIQADNPHSEAAVSRLHDAVRRLVTLVRERNVEGFAGWMRDAAELLPLDRES
jgi:chorismate mutase/prephenate dehydrogenase